MSRWVARRPDGHRRTAGDRQIRASARVSREDVKAKTRWTLVEGKVTVTPTGDEQVRVRPGRCLRVGNTDRRRDSGNAKDKTERTETHLRARGVHPLYRGQSDVVMKKRRATLDTEGPRDRMAAWSGGARRNRLRMLSRRMNRYRPRTGQSIPPPLTCVSGIFEQATSKFRGSVASTYRCNCAKASRTHSHRTRPAPVTETMRRNEKADRPRTIEASD